MDTMVGAIIMADMVVIAMAHEEGITATGRMLLIILITRSQKTVLTARLPWTANPNFAGNAGKMRVMPHVVVAQQLHLALSFAVNAGLHCNEVL